MITLTNGWKLRKRQEECHDKIIGAFNSGREEFLLAANCRFGKTITTLQSLKDYAAGDHVIVVISTMNIKKEWTKGAKVTGYDLTLLSQPDEKPDEKGEIKWHEVKINDIDFDSIGTTGTHIIYVSTQKLGNESVKSEELIRWFNNHSGKKFLVYDECHLGSGTERTTNVLDRLDFDNKIYLSGTPYRKHLKEEFDMDKFAGEEKIYLYTLVDEREDYLNKVIDDYVPVQLEMHVLDYAKDIDSLVDVEDKEAVKYGVSSAYFKRIFSKPEYKSYAEEFLNKIIDFANLKGIKTFLFYVPLKSVGNDIVKNFKKQFENQIEFRNLCGDYSDKMSKAEEDALDESEAAALSEFYAEPSDKIKIGITCNKCGTGTTLEGLDAVAFLKDTTQAIPFIQKSQRVRTPEKGKSVGYCLCFNQWQGLKAFMDYSRAVSKKSDTSEREAVEKAIENGAVKLVLNLEEVKDYNEIIDILNIYKPGVYTFFDDFEFDEWPDDTFTFLNSLEKVKSEILERHPELRNDPDFNNADDCEALKRALNKSGNKDEADNLHVPTKEEMRQLLEDNFVYMVRMMFNFGMTKEEMEDTDNYDETLKAIITVEFGTEEIWRYILTTYPRYISMVYNYLIKK